MTKPEANEIASLALALYGAQVEATIDTSRVRGDQGYRVFLQHKRLHLRVSLISPREWKDIQGAWAERLSLYEEVKR